MTEAANNASRMGITLDAAPAAAIPAEGTTPNTVRLGLHLRGRDFMLIKANVDATKPMVEVMKHLRHEYEHTLTAARPRCIPPCPFVEGIVQIGSPPSVSGICRAFPAPF